MTNASRSALYKKLFFVFLFCIAGITEHTFAQGTLCDALLPTSRADSVITALQDADCLEEIEDIDSAKKLVQLLDLDVIKYFDLGGIYDTDQKQADFKKTKDYQDMLESLTQMKKDAQNKIFYSVLTTELGDYRWDVKGFKFNMDKLDTRGGLSGQPPPSQTILYDIELASLPFNVEFKVNQTMTLPVVPDSGLAIMRNKDSIMTVVLFTLGPVYDKEYSYYNAQCTCNRNAKEEVIKTKYDRVMIFNTHSNEIFYDKMFDTSYKR